MSRFFLYFAFDGSNYAGWQAQPNAPSVQATVERALAILAQQPVHLTAAGRTDAGVHARAMPTHFDPPPHLIPLLADLRRLNSLLPPDIAATYFRPVPPDAHARFDATSRTYVYILSPRKNPFLRQLALTYPTHLLDRMDMNDAANLLLHTDDFTSFAKLHAGTNNNRCRVTHAAWDDDFTFTITADRFLRNMVRAIVGTLLDVGRGKLSVSDFQRIIDARDRAAASTSAPPHALFLHHVTYFF
ncbi:MAG: tRNA pseudouridine(38-40) synthase TruA [Tannerellaceae bacterium]|jgi:tRNA pseudouridine38-40 synthase|nr:tRNA pseudouridine(38-40) synthase TruA [Tannerellaceae bacterium]